MNAFDNSEILLIGGTGTLGNMILRRIVDNGYSPKGIRIFSRDELKQSKLKRKLSEENYPFPVAFLIGDVRDYDRLNLAMHGVNIVINAAAMKHIDICEVNPIEAVRTNVNGAENVVKAALNNMVHKVMQVSTDKAVYPTNLYGATKSVAEKLMIQANVYGAFRDTRFSCCRYGNVIGSRGSVVKLFMDQYKAEGRVKITHPDMTRFWIDATDAADFVLKAILCMTGGEIFIPIMKSSNIKEMADAVCGLKDTPYETIGIRTGEKLHECMISEEEAKYTYANSNMQVIHSPIFNKNISPQSNKTAWTSLNNEDLIDSEGLKNILTPEYIMEVVAHD